jgi:hypothetical protein
MRKSFKILVVKCSQLASNKVWWELVVKHYWFGICYETTTIDRVYDSYESACEVADRYRDYILHNYYNTTTRLICNEFNSHE